MGFFRSGCESKDSAGGKTIIAAGCSINGEINKLEGDLHNDGLIEGVISTEYDLSVGESGCVKGLVKARNLVISGRVEGKVACDKLEILKGGKLVGELICREFVVESGGQFIGQRHEMTESGTVVSLPENFEQLKHDRLITFAGLTLVVEEPGAPQDRQEDLIESGSAGSEK